MNNHPEDPSTETPMQRVLRLKKAAQAAKPKRPGAETAHRRQAAAMALGASKPALRK
jgi:hypothetical protein